MAYTHLENDRILDEWEKMSVNNNEGSIEYDGVAYKGEVKSFRDTDGKIFYQRQPANEEADWNNSQKRILFVGKELNDEDGYDSRVAVMYDPENDIIPSHKFIINMLHITKGLSDSSVDFIAEFPSTENIESLMKVWDESAVAKINVKKQPGGASADMNSIAEAMEKYNDLLCKQLHLLNANIIVCCDARNIVLSKIKDIAYPDAKQINDYVWYDASSDTMLISGFHLSAPKSYEDVYSRVVENYVDALEKINNENHSI